MASLRVRALVLACLGLLATSACGARVDVTANGDAATDAATDAACPAPNPGLCAPSIECVDGQRRTGEALCVDGAWSCVTEACGDAGADARSDASDASDAGGGCNGAWIATCDAGTIGGYCCPPGAPCAAPIPYCDLGGGRCVQGDCPVDGGCAKGSIAAADYPRACAKDSDCAAVYEGSACGACYCPNAAIAKSALAQYKADFQAKNPDPGTCACPLIPAPRCLGGTCTMP
jgi:hypothetical protein